jgi:DNA-binding transcriptional LysR family regulator
VLDHDLLRSFVTISDAGSFTAASEIIGRTPSAVSMQIRRLEDQVGGALFERSAHGVKLTQRGEVMLIHARRILNCHRDALEALVDAGTAETVTFGIPEEYVESLLPALVVRMAEAELPVALRVTCEPSHQLTRRLDENALDLAVVTEQQVGDDRGDEIRRERALWVCGAHFDPRSCDQLPLAVDTEGCAFRRAALEYLAASELSYRLAIIGSHPVVRAAVMAGGVVGLIPECALLPGMRTLGPTEGFGQLPPVVLRLRRANRPRSKLTDLVVSCLSGMDSDGTVHA